MWVKIAVEFAMSLLGAFFPSLKPPSPEAEAQKQKDRADNAEALLKAKVQSDKIENNVAAGVAVNPASLRKHDANELQ